MDISLRFIFSSKRNKTRIKELEALSQRTLDQYGDLLDKHQSLLDRHSGLLEQIDNLKTKADEADRAKTKLWIVS